MEHNTLTQLINRYVELERDRKSRIEQALDTARNGNDIQRFAASLLMGKKARSTGSVGVTPKLISAFEELMTELCESPCLCRFEARDGATLPVIEDGRIRMYSQAELIPDSPEDYQETPVMLPLVALCVFNEDVSPTVTVDDVIAVPAKVILSACSGDLSYQFIAADESLNSFDFSCLN